MKAAFIIIILLLVSPVRAAENPTSGSVGSYMVSDGLKIFTYAISDALVMLSNGNSTVNHSEAPSAIAQLLTLSIDPYQYAFVQEWQNVMIIFFVILTVLMILLGGSGVLIRRTSPDIAYRISWLMDSTEFFDVNKWLSTIGIAIAFLALGTFGIYYLLQLEYVISAIITERALLIAPPTIENFLAYLMFAVVYFVLSVIMAIRAIIILLMAAGALGLMALYLIPQTRNFAVSAFMYFLVILFLQPVLLFIATVGLAFVQAIPMSLVPLKGVIVVGLTLFMAIVAIMCILGIGLVRSIIYLGARAAL